MTAAKGRAAQTRERILEKSAELFSAHGADALSALDIATALGMSPGHLYYHFKGKDQILAALYDRHLAELGLIMAGAREAQGLSAAWTHIHIMLEEIYDARFFYRSLYAVTGRNDALAAKFRKAMFDLRHTLRAMLETLTRNGTLPAKDGLVDVLAEQTLLGLLFRLNLQGLEAPSKSGREQAADAALFVMTLIAAHAQGVAADSLQKPARSK